MEKITNYDKSRYNRQMLIEGWGEEGQLKLKNSTVFIAGAGGLGSPVSIYLAVAGVGEIRVCDRDRIELSNLNRQILHPEARIGELKAISTGQSLGQLNQAINIVTFSDFLNEHNVDSIVGRPDIVVDCLDNFETRYLLNSYCLKYEIPLVHGAIWGMMGQASFIQPPHTPCLRCLFPEPPPKDTLPVVGATPGIIGCIQAMEVLKYLTNIGTNLKGVFLLFDGEEMSFTRLKAERSLSCPDCSKISPR